MGTFRILNFGQPSSKKSLYNTMIFGQAEILLIDEWKKSEIDSININLYIIIERTMLPCLST